MRIATPFAPIEIGEADYFAFDFMADVGAATIVSTSWNCALGPYETAIDPTPQSRVFSVSRQTAIQLRSPMDGSLQTRTGAFSVALIGGMPASAAGGNYVSRGHCQFERRTCAEAQFDGAMQAAGTLTLPAAGCPVRAIKLNPILTGISNYAALRRN